MKEVIHIKKLITLFSLLVCVVGLVGCNTEITDRGESAGTPAVETRSEVQPGGTPVEEAFDIAVSYANWTEESEIYFGALNKDKMAISSVQHLPIYKFDTFEELEQFKLAFGETLSMEHGWDEVSSFNDTTATYDKNFFEDNTLMLVYVSANNSSHRYGVSEIFCDGTHFCIHIEETTGLEEVDTAMAGWFITVAVPDSMVAKCTEFDADLNNNFD